MMQIARRWIVFVSVLVLGTAVASAQQMVIQGPDREVITMGPNARQFKTGTGRIVGRVLAAETGAPIRRAQLRLTGPEIGMKAALTDTEGRFEFRDLPAGRFNLQATKSGFVTIHYGQTRPFESGRPIELAEKQALENADISMPRGSVIAGRILDEFGDPIPDVTVSAMRQTWAAGRRRLLPVPGGRLSQTNDLGQYRIFGLPPGEYYVSATLRGGPEMMAVEMFAAAGQSSRASGSVPTSGYAPTYFPGTSSATEAQRVALTVGQETSNTDFALLPVRLARITGTVINSEGKPVTGAMINVMPASRGELFVLGPGSTTRTDADGNFTLNGVAPGEYSLHARTVQVFTTTSGAETSVMMFRSGGPSGGDDNTEFGTMPVTIAGEDLANLVIVTTKGATATGRIVFEGGAKPTSMTGIRLGAMPADAEGPALMSGGGATVKEDGTFEMKGLTGTRLIRTVGLPSGWRLKSVTLNGVDITDTGAEFRGTESVTGVDVVLTASATSINGGVTSSDGTPLKDYTVVIFSENPDHWSLPMTRWVTGTRPNQEGRFKVDNMPAGSYYAVAVDYLPQGEWGDPELLERLRAKGRRFTLDDGQTETLDLKLSDVY